MAKVSLPLSLEIVGADRSHLKAGSAGGDLIACHSVANDSQILGRLFALLASNLCVVPQSTPKVVFILIIDPRYIFESQRYSPTGLPC